MVDKCYKWFKTFNNVFQMVENVLDSLTHFVTSLKWFKSFKVGGKCFRQFKTLKIFFELGIDNSNCLKIWICLKWVTNVFNG